MKSIGDKMSFWEKIVSWGTVIVFLLTPLLYSNGRIASAVTSKQYFFIGMVDILLVAWTWLLLADSRYRLTKKNWLAFVPVGIFIISMGLSTFLGADIPTSLFSTIERGVGLIFILHACVFAMIVASLVRVQGMMLVKKIAQAILVSAIGVAIMTFFTKDAFSLGITWLDESVNGAMLGNSTIVGSYFIFAIFLSLVLWFQELSKIKKTLYGIGIAIMLVSPTLFNVRWLFGGNVWSAFIQSPFIVIGQARAAALSLVLGIIIALCVYGISTSKKKVVTWLAGLGIVVIIGALIVGGVQLFQTGSTVQKSFINQVGENRILFWGEAVQGISDRPIIGWGPENFRIVHQKYFHPLLADAVHGSESWVDKPHNTFIEILVTQGIVGLVTYLVFLGFFFWMLIRSIKQGLIDTRTGALFIGLLFAYVLQNQFAFDSIISTICLFMMIGITIGFWDNNQLEKKSGVGSQPYQIMGWIVLVAMIPVWAIAAYLPSRKMVQAKTIFDEPVNVRTSKYDTLFSGAGSYGFKTDLGMIFYTLAESYLSQRSTIQANENLVKIAIPELEALIKVGEDQKRFAQNDFRFMLAMAMFQETKMGLTGRFSQEELDKLTEYITGAIKLSPTNPFAYLVYNKILLYSENIDEARAAIDYAISLNPIIKESHEQKIGFERAFGTYQQQQDALKHAKKYFPDYQF